MLHYIELRTGYRDNVPAWIGRVRMSRSGQTVYFNGKAFKRTTAGAPPRERTAGVRLRCASQRPHQH